MALRKQIFRVCSLNNTRMLHSIRDLRLQVEHDRPNSCFFISLDVEGKQDNAVLRYRFTGEKEVDLFSTIVPESFRGKGVAALLSKAAMEFLVEENLKAYISCSYIKKYVEENTLLGYDHIIF
uniref:Protein NATD1 n=1 Tax=Esox lucius TaxID=8010 RepID=A0AAY5KWD1_ESOLU